MARITQLFNKTNQFNLTTIRYSQKELESLIENKDNNLFYMEMSDRFGEYGIIGCALLEKNTIDSFLLSCRAFGKQAEYAFLYYLLQFKKKFDSKEILSYYKQTLKNSMAKDFYKNCGFTLIKTINLTSIWQFDLTKDIPEIPDWFSLT